MDHDADRTLPPEAVDMLRAIWGDSSPSSDLRVVVDQFKLEKSQVTHLLMDVFSNLRTPHVQAVWNWAYLRNPHRDGGLSDDELDAELAALEVMRAP
jgi:hypothetical protein